MYTAEKGAAAPQHIHSTRTAQCGGAHTPTNPTYVSKGLLAFSPDPNSTLVVNLHGFRSGRGALQGSPSFASNAVFFIYAGAVS